MINAAIILVAGDSTRFKSSTPKQFYLLNGKPLFWYALEPFAKAKNINKLVVVAKKEHFEEIKKYVPNDIALIEGGKTRFESVDNALNYLSKELKDDDRVLIHDGARPFVSEEQINNLLQTLDINEAATLAIKVEDTLGIVNNNYLEKIVDRNNAYRIQTPQAFRFKTILNAHKFKQDNPTDDTQLCLSLGIKVAILLGSKKINKITTIEDLYNVGAILKNE